MFAKTIGVTALLWGLTLPAAAQRVTETTVPLADPNPGAFYFLRGDIGVVVRYDGSGKVDAKISAFNLASSAPLWHSSLRVQESQDSPGRFLNTFAREDRLYFGNGPLTVLDAATGRTLWSLDCRTIGSIDFHDAEYFADGDFLLEGTDGCGNLDNPRVLRVNDATGAVRWQVSAEAHTYNTGRSRTKTEHRDFSWFWSGTAVDTAAVQDGIRQVTPARIVLAGERLSAVDYGSGQPAWAVRDKPGRIIGTEVPGMSLWMKDDKLSAYSYRDGAKLWSADLGAPWAVVFFVDEVHPGTSDLIAVTWKGAFRFDRSGNQKWAVKRDDSGWGQQMSGSLLVIWTKRHHYIGIDLATGQTRWTGELDTPGDFSLVRPDLSSAATGVVLITTYDRSTGPYGLNAFDATTGQRLWRMNKIEGDKISDLMIDSTRLVVETDGPDREQYEIELRSGATEEVGHTSRRRDAPATVGPVATGHYRVSYSRKRKTLTGYGPDGHALWTRKGRLSENADFEILAQEVVVWPTQDGKVEFIALTSGASLYTATGDDKPHIGVDTAAGRVLVPQGKTLKILTIGS